MSDKSESVVVVDARLIGMSSHCLKPFLTMLEAEVAIYSDQSNVKAFYSLAIFVGHRRNFGRPYFLIYRNAVDPMAHRELMKFSSWDSIHRYDLIVPWLRCRIHNQLTVVFHPVLNRGVVG